MIVYIENPKETKKSLLAKLSIKGNFLNLVNSKTEIHGNFLNLIKGIYKNLTANIIHNSERMLSFKIWNKARTPAYYCPYSTTSWKS